MFCFSLVEFLPVLLAKIHYAEMGYLHHAKIRFLKSEAVHHSDDKVFSGAQYCPTSKNPTFVPRDVEIERLRRDFDISSFYLQFLQGTMSATKNKIYINLGDFGPFY